LGINGRYYDTESLISGVARLWSVLRGHSCRNQITVGKGFPAWYGRTTWYLRNETFALRKDVRSFFFDH